MQCDGCLCSDDGFIQLLDGLGHLCACGERALVDDGGLKGSLCLFAHALLQQILSLCHLHAVVGQIVVKAVLVELHGTEDDPATCLVEHAFEAYLYFAFGLDGEVELIGVLALVEGVGGFPQVAASSVVAQVVRGERIDVLLLFAGEDPCLVVVGALARVVTLTIEGVHGQAIVASRQCHGLRHGILGLFQTAPSGVEFHNVDMLRVSSLLVVLTPVVEQRPSVVGCCRVN